MKLDKMTIIRQISELELAYKETMQKSRDFEHLTLTATNYYNQAKVYEYLIQCLKEKL